VFTLLALLGLACLGSRLQVTQENSGEMSEIVVAACNHWETCFGGPPKNKLPMRKKKIQKLFFAKPSVATKEGNMQQT